MGLEPLTEEDLPGREQSQPTGQKPRRIRRPQATQDVYEEPELQPSLNAFLNEIDVRYQMPGMTKLSQDEAERRAKICAACPGKKFCRDEFGHYCEKASGCWGNRHVELLRKITGLQCQPCLYWTGEIIESNIPTQSPHVGCQKKNKKKRIHTNRGLNTIFKLDDNITPPFITVSQLARDTISLLPKLPKEVTAVAGVARSGVTPATILATMLHVPLLIVRPRTKDWIPADNGWRLGNTDLQFDGVVLVVDDTVMTGNSLKQAKELVESIPGKKLFANIYVNPNAKQKPDLWAVDLPWPHILEWNVFNSILSESFVTDFDGILCEDCPAGSDDDGEKYIQFLSNTKSLYLPKRKPVSLIVTARMEKYRQITESWLEQHGIKCLDLVMGDWQNLQDRTFDKIIKLKSAAFEKFLAKQGGLKPKMFFESDPRQAEAIAKQTGGLVVCPKAGKCYVAK
jgi:orotate phosphoribosyltransferase